MMVSSSSILQTIFVIAYLVSLALCQQCIIDAVNDLKVYLYPYAPSTHQRIYRPIFMDPYLNFIYPTVNPHTRQLQLDWSRKDLLVYCPDASVQVSNGLVNTHQISQPQSVPPVIRCVGQTNNKAVFRIESGVPTQVSIDQLTCHHDFRAQDWFDHSRACAGGRLMHIGFAVPPTQGKSVMQACFDTNRGTTLWSSSIIRQGIVAPHPTDRLGHFIKGSAYNGIDVANFYELRGQINTFTQLFQNAQYISKWIRGSGNGRQRKNYFVRGHLIANQDMYYVTEQYSTFNYANVVPMWDSINNGNWKAMEEYLRQIAGQRGDLKVWAGGVGTLKLENREIWLGNRGNQRFLPVPEILFKLAYCEKTNQAIAFIAINNPYATREELARLQICRPLQNCQMPNFNNVEYGYTYCCSAHDFLNSRPIMPLQLMTNIPGYVTPLA